jgi:hypothetical protein
MVSRKPKVGDVFIIPTGDDLAGVGQVVGSYGKDALYLAIFDIVLPPDGAAERAGEALTAPVLLLGLSMDAKIYAGHWTIVGHAPVDPAIPLPAYKEAVGAAGAVDVVDYSGDRRRAATAAEAAALPNRKVVARCDWSELCALLSDWSRGSKRSTSSRQTASSRPPLFSAESRQPAPPVMRLRCFGDEGVDDVGGSWRVLLCMVGQVGATCVDRAAWRIQRQWRHRRIAASVGAVKLRRVRIRPLRSRFSGAKGIRTPDPLPAE